MKSPWYENQQHAFQVDIEDQEDSYFINQNEKKLCSHVALAPASNTRVLIPWTLATLFGITSLIQFLFSPISQPHPYATGFQTEFADGFSHISLTRQRFTSGIRAFENGTFYMSHDKDQPIYAAPPSPEVDQAWEDLEGLLYINLTDTEIARLNQDPLVPAMKPFPPGFTVQHKSNFYDLGGGYYSSIAMIHQIHCLNMIRRRMDRQYYGDEDGQPPEIRRMHLDHCLDNIRQAILCHGDMTPVTMRPITRQSGGVIIAGDTERMRTCRNSDQIIEYAKLRGEKYMNKPE